MRGCKVSVIVPVYRVEGYIGRCIKSLAGQTLKEIEIICICEKEDKSYGKLSKYAQVDSRIKVIEKKNTGVSAARNAGMRASTGKYMAFVDADDWIEKYAFELLYEVAQEHGAQITAYGIWPTVEPGRDKRGIFHYTPDRNAVYHGNTMKALFYQCGSRPYIGNKFYNTQFMQENGIYFNEGLAIGEDQLLQFEAFSRADTVCFVKEKLYHYDITRNTSAMNRCSRRQVEQKNFLLLKAVMERKRRDGEEAYNKEYALWILQDFAWVVNRDAGVFTDEKREMIYGIKEYLNELDAGKYVSGLPREYRELCRRYMECTDDVEGYETIALPYKEYDKYAQKQLEGLYQQINAPGPAGIKGMCRRIYEIASFHELRHLMTKALVRII